MRRVAAAAAAIFRGHRWQRIRDARLDRDMDVFAHEQRVEPAFFHRHGEFRDRHNAGVGDDRYAVLHGCLRGRGGAVVPVRSSTMPARVEVNTHRGSGLQRTGIPTYLGQIIDAPSPTSWQPSGINGRRSRTSVSRCLAVVRGSSPSASSSHVRFFRPRIGLGRAGSRSAPAFRLGREPGLSRNAVETTRIFCPSSGTLCQPERRMVPPHE